MQGQGREYRATIAFGWPVLAAILTIILAGCTNGGDRPTAANASARGASISFESIDGAPPEVSRKLVEALAAEAAPRQVNVVARSATPDFRIRLYLAANKEGGRSQIAWVWDVYDAQKRRAARLTGEEAASAARGRDPWTAADTEVLRRIARASVNQLVAMLEAGPGPRPADGEDGMAVALSNPQP
jgi:hypothetical protein